MANQRSRMPFLEQAKRGSRPRNQPDKEEPFEKTASQRKQHEEAGNVDEPSGKHTAGRAPKVVKPRPDNSNVSSAVRSEYEGRSQNVNFGRAFGVRPLEEKVRERPVTPLVRKSVDEILHTTDQSAVTWPKGPKRRTIEEILGRSNPGKAKPHPAPVREPSSSVARKEPMQLIPTDASRTEDGRLLYKSPATTGRSEPRTKADRSSEKLETNSRIDSAMIGMSRQRSDEVASTSNEHKKESAQASLNTLTTASTRVGEDLDIQAQMSQILLNSANMTRNTLYNFSTAPAPVPAIVPPPRPRPAQLSRPEARWTRVDIVGVSIPSEFAEMDLDSQAKKGGGDAPRRVENTVEILPSMEVTLMRMHALNEEEEQEYQNILAPTTASQTGLSDDNPCDVEVQTDDIETVRMWTQHPIQVSMFDETKKKHSLQVIRSQSMGVGPDPEDLARLPITTSTPELDAVALENQELALSKFIQPALKVILEDLDSSYRELESQDEVVASKDYGKLEFDLDSGKTDASTITLVISERNFIACAKAVKQGNNRGDTTISIWEASNPTKELYVLLVRGKVTAMSMSSAVSMVFAGSENGALCIFSTLEAEHFHVGAENSNGILRASSVYTGSMTEDHHTSEILAVEALPDSNFAVQIITMDESMLICWTCLQSSEKDRSAQLGHHNAAWSPLRLRMIQKIDLKEVNCYACLALSLKIWQADETHFIIGTNAGFVLKGTVAPKEIQPVYQLHFLSSYSNVVTNVRSVDVNCSRELYVACTLDNQFHVVYLKRSKVICTLPSKLRPIKVRWSRERPSLFYVAIPTRIMVYDLLKSDMYPMANIPFDEIVDFDILNLEAMEYLVIVFENGKSLHVETLKFKTCSLTEKEAADFRHFLSIST